MDINVTASIPTTGINVTATLPVEQISESPVDVLATADLTDNTNEAALLSNDTLDEFIADNFPPETVDVNVNGSPFAQDVTGTVDIPVKDAEGTARGSKVGNDWQIATVSVAVNDQDANNIGSGNVVAGKPGQTIQVTVDKTLNIALNYKAGSHTFPNVFSATAVDVGTIASFTLANCSALTILVNGSPKTYTGTTFDAPFAIALNDTISIQITITNTEQDAIVTLIGTHS